MLPKKTQSLVKTIIIYNNKQQDGFTVNQMLIGLIVIGVVVGVAITLVLPRGQNSDLIKKAATENLINFSKQAELKPGECVNQDSDNNGYVDCTAKDEKAQLISLECAYDKRGKSCKIK
ncbi:hypothetical protein IQ247_03170 [Plectonema cf. radiosum LEGE 06105]|uniref:Uncharacterized protein n=1 Tax=Plectonema cf. radiosum LEGE 06105 TaxID=945769 RepID=A0A8J7JYV7_9CYAN|nr:hypothetical protein [Plectonema radiosum]MBE9211726.1 hypothetical protein [Plectonema cf. radiosum LEGE 06105]